MSYSCVIDPELTAPLSHGLSAGKYSRMWSDLPGFEQNEASQPGAFRMADLCRSGLSFSGWSTFIQPARSKFIQKKLVNQKLTSGVLRGRPSR